MGAPHNNPGVEPEDINTSTLFKVIFVSTIVVIALVAVGFNMSHQKFKAIQMEVTQLTGYPALDEKQMMGASKLNGYADNGDGTYRIPIERAMELEAADAQ